MFFLLISKQIKPKKDHPRRQCKFTQIAPINISDSAIGQYFLDNKFCAEKFIISCFSILVTRR